MEVLLSTLSRKACVLGRKKLLVVAEVHLTFTISLGERLQRHCTPVQLNGLGKHWSSAGSIHSAGEPQKYFSATDLKFKAAVVSEREAMIPPHLLQTKHVG